MQAKSSLTADVRAWLLSQKKEDPAIFYGKGGNPSG